MIGHSMVTFSLQFFHYRSNKQNIYLHLHSANSPQFGLTVFSPFRDIVSNKCSIPLWLRLSTCSYLTTAWMPSLRSIFSNMWIFANSFSPDVTGNLVHVPKFWYLVFWVLDINLHAWWLTNSAQTNISAWVPMRTGITLPIIHVCNPFCFAWCCDGGCHCYFYCCIFHKMSPHFSPEDFPPKVDNKTQTRNINCPQKPLSGFEWHGWSVQLLSWFCRRNEHPCPSFH